MDDISKKRSEEIYIRQREREIADIESRSKTLAILQQQIAVEVERQQESVDSIELAVGASESNSAAAVSAVTDAAVVRASTSSVNTTRSCRSVIDKETL
jgi:t-SNARE complex subunit (syntaxin)